MKLLILSMSLMLNVSLFAQEASGQKMSCAADVKKFCASVEKGQGRIVKCLKEHEKEISPDCLGQLAASKEKMRAKAKDIYTNCKDDLQKLCKEAAAGKGGKLKCLENKKDQLSAKCKETLPEAKK
ncbi:MAG: cysteine rich repeat-containing protein [Bacteriovorax sp.]|nr:cysteine rich repeat-containing protein [Bacteriovorax sp.]